MMMDSVFMDTSENNNMLSATTDTSNSELPAWRMPITTSFSSSLRERLANAKSVSPERSVSSLNSSNINKVCPAEMLLSAGSAGGGSKRGSLDNQIQQNSNINTESNMNNNNNENSILSNEEKPAVSRKNSSNAGNNENEEDSQTVIQILLPCIVCNRTFSPEALERHAKVCTKVNIKSPYKPTRGTFDISEKRKKGTKLEDFIPPPPTFDALTDNRFGFSRGSRSRTSLRGTSCTTRSTLNTPLPSGLQRRERSVSQSREGRERSVSTTRTPSHLAPPPQLSSSTNSQNEYPYDDTSEFGSNNSEEMNNAGKLPSYAQPIAPTDLCPYCNRTFGIKSYDRHVEFCKEIYERKRYEIQPTPKEKEEALERQEIRTKYRPMKSSSSCSSLRSMSPGKDFTSMAMKLFGGLRRTEGTTNLYFNQIKNNLKKSNESIANSCYGDYTRGLRRTSPSPARSTITGSAATNKLNNLLTKTYLQHHHQQQQQNQQQLYNQYGYPIQSQQHPHGGGFLPMHVNTGGNMSANIPKMTKSTDNLIAGNNYAHVRSSGYGQPPSVLSNMSNNFSRNSRSRSSLHKNFFRTKRADPDGTENTSSQSPTATSPLIITPVNFYAKGIKSSSSALDLSDNNHKNDKGGRSEIGIMMENARPSGTSLLSSDPDYDPYEKAAKQLEELLKTTPVKSSKRSTRRAGLEKAFESVGVPSDLPSLGKSKLGRALSLDYNSDPFGRAASTLLGTGGNAGRTGFGAAGRSDSMRRDPFGLGEGTPMMMTPNIDDSYWDQILRKGENQHGNNTNTNQETVSSQEESDTTSGASDTAKSRAMSNTSSADSAFSR